MDSYIMVAKSDLARLQAQVDSIGRHGPGMARPETWPDDTEINEDLREAESFADALGIIIEKYNIPVTNNYARWQDGEFIREAVEFMEDIAAIAKKFFAATEPWSSWKDVPDGVPYCPVNDKRPDYWINIDGVRHYVNPGTEPQPSLTYDHEFDQLGPFARVRK